MRAMVYTAPSTLEIQDVGEPTPREDEVLVRVAACGICGSELHGIQQPGFRKPPLVMGHEFSGTTIDGRRVVVNPIVSCYRCELCQRGLTNLCQDRAVIGIHRSGAFAELVSVPEACVYEIPDAMSWEDAALIEPLANAVHAWRLAGESAPERVGIIGGGTIGLVALLVASRGGTAEVTVVDLSEDRLSVARKLGADATGPSLEGEYDVIIEAVGLPATKRASIEHLRRGGIAVWQGLAEAETDVDSQDVIRSEKRIVGSFAYTEADFRAAINLVPKVDLSWSSSYPLEEGVDIFMELMHGRTDVVKALLRP